MVTVAERPAARAATWGLPRFEGHSATETVRQMIREAIVEGRIPPGEQLREARLVEMLGISRGTVREAIRHLVQEGLVEYRMHHGAFVKAQMLEDRLDVYVAREAIEVWAAKTLLEKEGLLDLTGLDAALARMRTREARQKRPTEETIAADLDFHHELVRLAGSERLTRAHETFAAETRILLRRHPPYPWRTYAEDHENLINAIRRKDAKTPEMVAEHLRLSARLLGGNKTAGNSGQDQSERRGGGRGK
jgi:DNA-binding GntR family transcriptional regulator